MFVLLYILYVSLKPMSLYRKSSRRLTWVFFLYKEWDFRFNLLKTLRWFRVRSDSLCGSIQYFRLPDKRSHIFKGNLSRHNSIIDMWPRNNILIEGYRWQEAWGVRPVTMQECKRRGHQFRGVYPSSVRIWLMIVDSSQQAERHKGQR